MSTTRYFITGASGFIGSCLLRALVRRHEDVYILIRKHTDTWRIDDLLPKVTCVEGDLTHTRTLPLIMKKIKPTIIYHLATHGAYPYQQDSKNMFTTNVLGTLNLLDSLNTTPYSLFVNTGSSSEYGLKKSRIKETEALLPNSSYAVSKAAQTFLATQVAKTTYKPIITLRLFSIYGPYEEPTRLIPTLLGALYHRAELHLVNPNIARDMVYIDDVVAAYLSVDRFVEHAGECFNICSGIQRTIGEIVQTAVQVTEKRTAMHWGAMKNRSWDSRTWVGDPTKTNKQVGWTATTTLAEGLHKTWNWYTEHVSLYEHH